MSQNFLPKINFDDSTQILRKINTYMTNNKQSLMNKASESP